MTTKKITTKKLTSRQLLFVAHYAKSLNFTEAYIEAGFAKKGANSAGPRLGQQPHIRAAIDAALKQQVDRVLVDADEVLRELKRLAFVDIRKAYDANGHLLGIKDIPEDVARAIVGIKVYDEFEGAGKDRVKVGEVREVKFADKIRGLELIGKYLKIFTDRVEHSVPPVPDPRVAMPAEELKALARAQLAKERSLPDATQLQQAEAPK